VNLWLDVEVYECGGWICGGEMEGFEKRMRERERDVSFGEERCVCGQKSDPKVFIHTLTLALTPLMFLMCFTNTQMQLPTSH